MESKLFYIRCDNCGAEYRISSRGEMNCPFCASKIYLNDQDFAEYQKVRDEMLIKDSIDNDMVNANGDVLRKWNIECQAFFETESGQNINCKYYYQYPFKDKTIYVGRNRISIVYKYDIIDRFISNVDSLDYPSSDIKGLDKFLPRVMLTAKLKGGEHLLVLTKPENVYPLAMVDNLDPKQVAWMISRMENLGCLLEFNGKDLLGLDVTDFYFNPKTHDIHLLGGWEALSSGPPQTYLSTIRRISRSIMNTHTAPQMCMDFLLGTPKEDAYDDFKAWDEVIVKGFGGHNFHHFSEANY